MFPSFWSWHIKLNRTYSGFGKMKSANDVIYVTDFSFLHGSTEFAAFYFISHELINKGQTIKISFGF